jgi:hypothetical protein
MLLVEHIFEPAESSLALDGAGQPAPGPVIGKRLGEVAMSWYQIHDGSESMQINRGARIGPRRQPRVPMRRSSSRQMRTFSERSDDACQCAVSRGQTQAGC